MRNRKLQSRARCATSAGADPGSPRVAPLWHRLLHRLLAHLYFRRVTVLHRDRIPDRGPVLYLGLHRNGAVDGFVYHSVLPGIVFVVSTQLRGSRLGRLFFHGIEVSRPKDRLKVSTPDALLSCKDVLLSGGRLFLFPEGTSSLGARHLPFKSGAAQILADYLTSGRSVSVVPLAIVYEWPWGFRRNVEVVVGRPISTELTDEERNDAVRTLRDRISTALEDVGVNVESMEYLNRARKVAYSATLGTSTSYYEALKSIETALPSSVSSAWRELETVVERSSARPLLHQGVPLFPVGSCVLYGLLLLVLAPLVLAAFALNLPPVLGAYWAGRNLSDDLNTISLWRILVGAPLAFAWVALIAAATAVTGQWLAGCAYASISYLGVRSYYRAGKLAVTVYNSVRHRNLRDRVLALHRTVLKEIPASKGTS